MPEDGRSHRPVLSLQTPDGEVEDGSAGPGTLLHSILTDGPPVGALYQPGPEGPDPDRSASPADPENGIDFGYSQKFFHIADGNLYSVFSPLQGRSYGGKPSFLRKQQCVVRESRGRGRKNPKRGLKFHNFLPSESITSEKEDKSLGGEGEIWKVHAECRLREEHGTKQIMVSNWSVSEGDGADPRPLNPDSDSDSLSSVRRAVDAVRLGSGSEDGRAGKGAELGAIVHRLGLLPEGAPREPAGKTSSARGCRRKRRKPLQTRKVVPYHQYLSMLGEEAASPLDLSCRSPSPSARSGQRTPSVRPHRSSGLRSVSLPRPPSAATDGRSSREEETGPPPLCPQSTPACLLSAGVRTDRPCSERWVTGGGRAEERRRPPRSKARSNQRTIIRKKLEDTFRQNGFLVKTKQVSDGEATFCKFRQLKKYTRYYLKSWQDHLPEEVHKLWKGFLPPKTAIPSGGRREERQSEGQ